MNSLEIPMELLMYDIFSIVFDIRLVLDKKLHPATGEFKALEDQLWRLFIRHAYYDEPKPACLREKAA